LLIIVYKNQPEALNNMENTETIKPKNKKLPIIFGVLILIGVIYGVSKYRYSLKHEVTDDAQIEGDINPVIARVTGYINKINFQEGQHVNKSDTLVVIDDNDLRIKLMQAEAALENAKASLPVSQANVSSAQASTDASNSAIENARIRYWKAEQDYNRYSNLYKDSAITAQQFDNARAEKESAQAQLNIATKQYSTSTAQAQATEKQVAVAQSVIAQKQADLNFAKLQLSYATVIAPVSGFASKKNIQPGQLVNAGTPMFSIVADTGIYIVANFKETQLKDMNIGDTVEIRVDAYEDKSLDGRVTAFYAATGAKFSLLPPDNATGNFVKVVQRLPVKISINADKDMLDKLHPGMSVKVFVKTD
jgi:membrane fusion protein (multidrug efflux system)